jgi:hypothetical protein
MRVFCETLMSMCFMVCAAMLMSGMFAAEARADTSYIDCGSATCAAACVTNGGNCTGACAECSCSIGGGIALCSA